HIRDLSVSRNIPGVLGFKETKLSSSIHCRSRLMLSNRTCRCGHCNKLAPEYENAAKALSKHDPPIVLAKVDANEEKNMPLATKYEVGIFAEFSDTEFTNFMEVAEKLSSSCGLFLLNYIEYWTGDELSDSFTQ
ncbi:hypothetical protein ACJX0J_034006, partial [Zea mays]